MCLEGEDPSDPACAPLLELLVDIQLARKDADAAAESLGRLAELAGSSGDGPRQRRRRVRRRPCARERGRRASLVPSPDRPEAVLGPRSAAGGRACAARARQGARLQSTRRGGRRGASRTRNVRTLRRSERRQRCGRPAPPAWEPPGGPGPSATGRSPNARPKCSRSWPQGARTPRSASASTSADEPPSTTWRASVPSWACGTAPRRPPTRCASRPKTRRGIGSPTDAAGVVLGHPRGGSSFATRSCSPERGAQRWTAAKTTRPPCAPVSRSSPTRISTRWTGSSARATFSTIAPLLRRSVGPKGCGSCCPTTAPRSGACD